MLCFPDAQQAAHDEIDQVIGRSRLPDINDEKLLPYVTALKWEVLR